jgi:hypothetical protein
MRLRAFGDLTSGFRVVAGFVAALSAGEGGRYRRNWRFRELPGRGQGNLAATGIAIGLSGALAATRILLTLLYEVKPSDPQTYPGVSAPLVALATLASYLPARRASRVEPSFP